MARLRKNEQPWYRITMSSDQGPKHTLGLVGGGSRSYLHVEIQGRDGLFHHVSFGGVKTLRALAKAILKEVGDA